jgi:hypothetical protein
VPGAKSLEKERWRRRRKDTKDVSGLGDRAAAATGSASAAGQAIGFSGIYLLKGSPSSASRTFCPAMPRPVRGAMEAEAQKALARVP